MKKWNDLKCLSFSILTRHFKCNLNKQSDRVQNNNQEVASASVNCKQNLKNNLTLISSLIYINSKIIIFQ